MSECAMRLWLFMPIQIYGPSQANLVLIAYASIRAVSPEPPLLAHTSSESRGTFRQKARSLAPLNGWARAVKIRHDGMLEDTNPLGAAHIIFRRKYRLRKHKSHGKCVLTNQKTMNRYQETGSYATKRFISFKIFLRGTILQILAMFRKP